MYFCRRRRKRFSMLLPGNVYRVESDLSSRSLDRIRQMAPKVILSAHLPPAKGKIPDRTGADIGSDECAFRMKSPLSAARRWLLQKAPRLPMPGAAPC